MIHYTCTLYIIHVHVFTKKTCFTILARSIMNLHVQALAN